jgi:hypothetical protein
MAAFIFPSWWWNLWQKQEEQRNLPRLPSPGFRWYHTESQLAAAAHAALDVAKREAWLELDTKTRTRLFRAFLVVSLQGAPLSIHSVPLGELGPHLYNSQERNAAGSAIARTLVLLAPDRIRTTSDIVTRESDRVQGSFETGALPVVVIILLVTVCALAAAYVGSLAAEAVNAVNFNDEVTKRMLSTQARAIEILSMHVERERIAGRQFPLDDAELSVLRSLEDTQRVLATAQSRPLPSPFDGATQFVRTASLSVMPLAAMGLVALILLETPKKGM